MAMAGLMLGAAVGVVACSDDDSDPMTLEAYIAAVDEIDNETTASIDAGFEGMPEEPTIDDVREGFGNIPTQLEEAADELEQLSPPEELEDQQEALVGALRDYAAAADDVIENAADATTVEAFFALTESEEFTAAETAFETACLDLQNYAADNGVTADLGCTDPEEGSAAAEQAIQDVVTAWNASDADAFAALFTDAGLVAVFGEGEDAPRADIVAFLPEVVGDGALAIREISSESTDTGADVTVLWVSGKVLESLRFSLIDDGGTWKIDGQETLEVEAPAGATVVNVDLNEFAFGLDASQITSASPIVLQGSNVGTQLHHMVFAKIPEDAVIEEILASDDPAGVENIGGGEPFPPGESQTLVIAEPLEPGRYALVCFLPDTTDPEETPHAFQGMVADITVE